MKTQISDQARALRKNPTTGAKYLWRRLRARQQLGYKFRRQHVIGVYIVDFICVEKKLIIEVDGAYHQHRVEADRQRDLVLGSKGYTVLRFSDHQLRYDLEGVVTAVRSCLIRG